MANNSSYCCSKYISMTRIPQASSHHCKKIKIKSDYELKKTLIFLLLFSPADKMHISASDPTQLQAKRSVSIPSSCNSRQRGQRSNPRTILLFALDNKRFWPSFIIIFFTLTSSGRYFLSTEAPWSCCCWPFSGLFS